MQIEQQLEVKVLAVEQFTIPYSIVEVNYVPILKKRMDILMKMLLTSFQSGAFTKTEQLASILMVEPLFINDLTRQMESSKLITLDDSYSLTAKGKSQLEQGIYEEQMPIAVMELVYSPLHEQFFAIDAESLELEGDLPEPLHYFENEQDVTLNEELVSAAIQQQLQEDGSDLVVQSIDAMDVVELYDFPVLLFICYDAKNDRLFSRAFNIYINEWDDDIGKFLDLKELTNWRKQYI